MITISNTTKKPIPQSLLKRAIEQTIKGEKHLVEDISAVYCGDKFIKKINQTYLSHFYPTDTISFRFNEGKGIEGEFYISIDTVKKNSINYHSTFKEELLRVTIHSCLHLIGYQDSSEKERLLMTKLENKYLSQVLGLK